MERTEFGVCTWTFGDLPLVKIARQLADLDFDGVELKGDLDRYTAREAAEILADHGLSVFSLTPADADLSHPDPAVRQEGIDYYDRLVDFAAELGDPLISCHGLVGRIVPLASQQEEDRWLADSVRKICGAAAARGLRIVFEVLNRYESHQIQTVQAASELVAEVEVSNLGILLDAYHMNIEEADPAGAILEAGSRLWLYHAADSNREGVGRGHTDFGAQHRALQEIGYAGPIIMECTAPGPNPFTPIKDEHSIDRLTTFLQESIQWFKNR